MTCTAPVCTSACSTAGAQVCVTARCLGRLIALVIASLAGTLFIVIVTWLPGHRRERRGTWALQQVSRWILRSIGIRMSVEGAPRSGPSLVVGNHISWLDILVLSASAPMRMVAKAEVGRWPIIGNTSRRVGTLFLQRERLRQLPAVVSEIAAVLRTGSRVQVFPEATTRCGGALSPFRRAAFQAAIDAGVVVSPVTLRYTDHQRMPTSAPAFVGDETLVASIRRVLHSRSTTVAVHWLRPIPAMAGTGWAPTDRANVARLAENAVARDLGVQVVGGPVAGDSTVRRPVIRSTAGVGSIAGVPVAS